MLTAFFFKNLELKMYANITFFPPFYSLLINDDHQMLFIIYLPYASLHSLLSRKSTRLPVKQSESSVKRSEPSTLKLPDASLLLNSPSLPSNMSGSYDHTSQVAAAVAQNVSRKRDSIEPKGSYPRGKIPRGNLPHSKKVPDTARGLLRPPQLSGRLVHKTIPFHASHKMV